MSEKITKDDVVELMRKTVIDNWFNPSMNAIDPYERAITLMSMEDYDDKEEDLGKIMSHIHNYPDFKIDNIYDIIYSNEPWNFMKFL